jgi:hypothetical protein
MQLEIKTEGVDFVVSRAPAAKNDAEGRQKADRETGALLYVTELVAMDATGAEVIKVTTVGEPKVVKRQFVTVGKLVATPWTIEGRGGVAFRAESITPSRPPRRLPLLRGRRRPALGRAVPDEYPDDHRPRTGRSRLSAGRAVAAGGG